MQVLASCPVFRDRFSLLSTRLWQAFGLAVGLCFCAAPVLAQNLERGGVGTTLVLQPASVIIRLPFHRFYREVKYEIRDGRAIYQGDIDLGPVKEVALRSAANAEAYHPNFAKELDQLRSSVVLDSNMLWPGGRVPFEIRNNDFDEAQIVVINDALDMIEANTTIRLVSRTKEKDYIRFRTTGDDSIGGSSPVGMQGGKQKTRLNPLAGVNTVIHEIAHSLGLYHTQSRSDRDQFVCLRSGNIVANKLFNFDIHDGDEGVGVYGAYNTLSRMHYSSCAFSICGSGCDTGKDTTTATDSCTTLVGRDDSGTCSVIIRANGAVPDSDWDAINFIYDPNFTPTDVSATRTITVNIDRVVTTRGPEEKGVGCNGRMDFFGELRMGVLADIAADPYRFVRSFTTPLDEVEGNDIRPDWRNSFVMGPDDRFGLVTIRLMDDHKKRAVSALVPAGERRM